jgi:hypothetical protein
MSRCRFQVWLKTRARGRVEQTSPAQVKVGTVSFPESATSDFPRSRLPQREAVRGLKCLNSRRECGVRSKHGLSASGFLLNCFDKTKSIARALVVEEAFFCLVCLIGSTALPLELSRPLQVWEYVQCGWVLIQNVWINPLGILDPFTVLV